MPQLSIIYAFRNRDTARIKASLESLALQTQQNFEVVFVDYGSDTEYSNRVKAIINGYRFANYHYIGHTGLLWCKARALNYGIVQASSEAIFIADADVVFHFSFTLRVSELDLRQDFYLFDIAYLIADLKPDEVIKINFNQREHKFVHDTFGVALFSKQSLLKVNGLDTFFHFYGSEDEDLNRRLQMAGYKKSKVNGLYIQHIWHRRYPKAKDINFTSQPRIFNIMRINQSHMFYNEQNKIAQVNKGIKNTKYYTPKDLDRLKNPDKIFLTKNQSAEVEHRIFFTIDEAFKKYNIIQLKFLESDIPGSTKYKLKKVLGKTVKPYYTFKTINDLLLKQILFRYRDHNYALKISENPNQIIFTIENRKS